MIFIQKNIRCFRKIRLTEYENILKFHKLILIDPILKNADSKDEYDGM